MLVAAQLCSRADRWLACARPRLLTAGVGQTRGGFHNDDSAGPHRLQWIGFRGRMLVRLTVTRLAIAVALLILAVPLAVEAQRPEGKLPRIGVLMAAGMTGAFQEPFREGLRDHGYVEGQNILIEWRAAEGRADRVKALADELVRLKVAVIVAVNTPAVQAVKNATTTIPIVMQSGDPVGTGLVAKPRAAGRQYHGHIGCRGGAFGQAN